MAANEKKPASVSVWYFVGATFVFTLPTLLFPDMPWWARAASIPLGAALIAVGIWQLRREMMDKKNRRK